MRQRKAKDLDKRLEACSEYIISAEAIRGNKEVLDIAAKKIYLEIGCGKGQFIIKKAMDNPDCYFLGIEGQETVILRAAEKAIACGEAARGGEENAKCEAVKCGEEKAKHEVLKNLRFINCFVHSMEELFDENQLDGIYLNFSDPWPKERHAKRRLTYHRRLEDYAWAIKSGGFIEIKTDNDGLFDFSLEEIERVPVLRRVEMTRDLHGGVDEYEARNTRTEYEDKFRALGKNINYAKLLVVK